MSKKLQQNFKISQEARKQLDELCASTYRTPSNLIEYLLAKEHDKLLSTKRVVAASDGAGILHLDPEFAKTGDSPVSCEQVSTK